MLKYSTASIAHFHLFGCHAMQCLGLRRSFPLAGCHRRDFDLLGLRNTGRVQRGVLLHQRRRIVHAFDRRIVFGGLFCSHSHIRAIHPMYPPIHPMYPSMYPSIHPSISGVFRLHFAVPYRTRVGYRGVSVLLVCTSPNPNANPNPNPVPMPMPMPVPTPTPTPTPMPMSMPMPLDL